MYEVNKTIVVSFTQLAALIRARSVAILFLLTDKLISWWFWEGVYISTRTWLLNCMLKSRPMISSGKIIDSLLCSWLFEASERQNRIRQGVRQWSQTSRLRQSITHARRVFCSVYRNKSYTWPDHGDIFIDNFCIFIRLFNSKKILFLFYLIRLTN